MDFDGKITQSTTEIVFIKNAEGPINVYPNPTSDLLNIAEWNKFSLIELYDVAGKKAGGWYNPKHTINIYTFNNGMYILKATKKKRSGNTTKNY